MATYPGQSQLAGGIDGSVTSLTLASAAGFPVPAWLVIDSEIIECPSAPVGQTYTGVTRGALGTTAAAHTEGTPVYGLYSKSYDPTLTGGLASRFNELQAELQTLEARISSAGGGIVQQAPTKTITSADILAQNLVTVVPAPGAGKVLCTLAAAGIYRPGTSPYSNAANLQVGVSVALGDFNIQMGFALNTLVASFANQAATENQDVISAWENQPIQAAVDVSGLTGGDGTIDVTVLYFVVNI